MKIRPSTRMLRPIAALVLALGYSAAFAQTSIWGSLTNTTTNSVNNLANQNTSLINNTVNSGITSGTNSIWSSVTGSSSPTTSTSSILGGTTTGLTGVTAGLPTFSGTAPAGYNVPTTFPVHVNTVSSPTITGTAQAAQNCTDTMTAINTDKSIQVSQYATKVNASTYMGNAGIGSTLNQSTIPKAQPSFDIMGFLINAVEAIGMNIANQMINQLKNQLLSSFNLSSGFAFGQRSSMLGQFGITQPSYSSFSLPLTSTPNLVVPTRTVAAPAPAPTNNIVYVEQPQVTP